MKNKFRSAMSFALALALSVSVSSAAFTAGRVDTNSKSLYVRPDPTPVSTPIGTLNKGTVKCFWFGCAYNKIVHNSKK